MKRVEEVPVSTSHSVKQRKPVAEQGQMVVEEGMREGVGEEGVGEAEKRVGEAEEGEEAGAVVEAEGEGEACSRDWTNFDLVDYSY